MRALMRPALRSLAVARRDVVRAVRQIVHRRSLLALIASVLLLFVVFDVMPARAGAAGFAVIAIGAGALPRKGLRRRPRPVLVAQKVIEGLPEPAIVLNAKGKVLSFNSKAAELFEGLRLDKHISSVIRNPNVLAAVAASSENDPSQTVGYVERVPVEQHLSVSVSWIAGSGPSEPSDRDPGILLFLRDLTEQERLNQMRADFIANASHELKTPLASVLGFIETLRGAARNDTQARERFLGIMAKQAERMAALIEDLMSLSRVEMKAHIRPQDLVEVNGTVLYVADALRQLAADSGVALEVDCLDGEAMVVGDSEEIVQVLQNLILNAIKYGRNGGHVWVKVDRVEATGRSPSRIAISVRDDGVGIAKDYLPRLTERFYRAPDGPAERAGTGLGLAIVKHVMNRHRGELKFTSERGKGSVFTVIFTESTEA
jgi:two-component system, OmpR family, phosphate regulon sensor histidine kinase PhoR